jgi:hypothetical protein
MIEPAKCLDPNPNSRAILNRTDSNIIQGVTTITHFVVLFTNTIYIQRVLGNRLISCSPFFSLKHIYWCAASASVHVILLLHINSNKCAEKVLGGRCYLVEQCSLIMQHTLPASKYLSPLTFSYNFDHFSYSKNYHKHVK